MIPKCDGQTDGWTEKYEFTMIYTPRLVQCGDMCE